MSVIINKFEIVPEATSRPKEVKPEPKESQAEVAISPLDIHSIAIHYAERMARIRAH